MAGYLDVARRAARAGALAAVRAMEEGSGAREAGLGRGGDVALEGDLAAERAVGEALEGELGSSTLVSEEAGELRRGSGGVTVVVDPVDGSRNYRLGIPLFATSVAVATGPTLSDVVAAAVYAPLLGLEMYAERGRGAYLNGRRVSVKRAGSELVVAVNSSPKASALPHALALLLAAEGVVLRNLGSACLELSLVAAGSLDAYVDPWFTTRVVDLAAALLLAREAGALVALRGRLAEEPLLSIDERLSLIAAAHEGAMELVRRALRSLGAASTPPAAGGTNAY